MLQGRGSWFVGRGLLAHVKTLKEPPDDHSPEKNRFFHEIEKKISCKFCVS